MMPLPLQGERPTAGYRAVWLNGSRRAARPDDRHHPPHPQAFADDYIDSISGAHGLAGAADTIIMLSRGRGKGEGVLRVTAAT